MNKSILLLANLLLAACAVAPEDSQEVLNETDAVQDYIKMQNLRPIAAIRRFEDPGVLFMNDTRYIIAYVRDEQWLLQYAHECPLAQGIDRPADKRRYTRVLYSRIDTFRGCPVTAMYPITLAHARELVAMGQAPGDR